MNNLLSHSLLALAVLISPLALSGEKVDDKVMTKADGKVIIDVQTGYVDIKSWDKNEVKVTGEIDEAAEGYQFTGTESGRVTFKVIMPKRKWGNWKDDGSKLQFWLPKGSELRFEGVNVDVEAKELSGGAKINTVNGDIKAISLAGRVFLETVNGDIRSENLSGEIRLNTVNGEIDDTSSTGELEIETVNGDIRTDTRAKELQISNVNGDMDLALDSVRELEISTVNGDIDLDINMQNTKEVTITTVGGDADIRFLGEISADFNVEAHSGGDIDNDISKDKVRKDKYGPGESLRFTMGSGKTDVEINTVSGDIRLKK